MAIITLAFDDGYADIYAHCAGPLADKGITATFAVPSRHVGGTLENRPVMSEQELLSLRNTGHEIASHTYDHSNLLELLDSEGEDAVNFEMKTSKVCLGLMLNTYISSMVFPFINDNNNAFLQKLASRYYTSSRITTEKKVFNPLPVQDPYSIIGMAVTGDNPIKYYNRIVDEISDKDCWLIEVFHLVSDTNTKSAHRDEPYRFFTHIDDFNAHVEYIVSKGVPIMTQGEAVKQFCL
ncbi:MAG: polysaccharide deacetylase family protein [Candidatus Tantalella remota]|nr:polysaccharide deacetylase family protein [Candidatus Tantalella remota]